MIYLSIQRLFSSPSLFYCIITQAVIAVFLMGGCSDSPTEGNNDNPGEPITGEYYVQARINGQVFTHQSGASGFSQTGPAAFSRSTSLSNGYRVSQTYSMMKVTFTNGNFVEDSLGASPRIIMHRTFPDQPTDDELDFLISVTMPYGGGPDKTNGVEILWTDSNGKNWCSSWGTGDQTGSAFKVTTNDRIQYHIGPPKGGRYKSSGTFNCTLYDGQGNSMSLTNGKFALQTVFD